MYSNTLYYLQDGRLFIQKVPSNSTYLTEEPKSISLTKPALSLTCMRGIVQIETEHKPIQRVSLANRTNAAPRMDTVIKSAKIVVQCLSKNISVLTDYLQFETGTTGTQSVTVPLPIAIGDTFVFTHPVSSIVGPISNSFNIVGRAIISKQAISGSGTSTITANIGSELVCKNKSLNSICSVTVDAYDIIGRSNKQIYIPYATIALDKFDFDMNKGQEGVLNFIIMPHYKDNDNSPLLSVS